MNGKKLNGKDIAELISEDDLARAGYKKWHSQEEWMVTIDGDGKISHAYAYVGYAKHHGQQIRYYKEM